MDQDEKLFKCDGDHDHDWQAPQVARGGSTSCSKARYLSLAAALGIAFDTVETAQADEHLQKGAAGHRVARWDLVTKA